MEVNRNHNASVVARVHGPGPFYLNMSMDVYVPVSVAMTTSSSRVPRSRVRLS